MVLLAEAAKTDVQKLPDKYRSDVGGEDLDEDVLTAEISALERTITTNNNLLKGMASDNPNRGAASDAVRFAGSTKREKEEKLRKLRAYKSASPGFFLRYR